MLGGGNEKDVLCVVKHKDETYSRKLDLFLQFVVDAVADVHSETRN